MISLKSIIESSNYLRGIVGEDLSSLSGLSAWFGKSVVKDNNGNPLRVYHGTNQPIKSFSKMRLGLTTHANSAKEGYFFTDSPDVASQYAAMAGKQLRSNLLDYEKKVKQYNKKLEYLEHMAHRNGNWDAYEKMMIEYEEFELAYRNEDDIIGQNLIPVYLRIENPLIYDFKGQSASIGGLTDIILTAKKNRNDGVIFKNINDPLPVSNHYIVFKSSQIKSATGNSGKYNPKKSDITKESMDAPPPIIRSEHKFSPRLIDYIKSVENPNKVGFKDNKWYPHRSPEGGLPTIALGHKIEKNELKSFSKGISNSEAVRLLSHDLEHAKKKVYSDIKSMFGVQIPLDAYQEEMLIDYAFNLGTLKTFPKFVRAVLNKDWDTARKEYIRTYKDTSGKTHTLGRNKIFFNTYLKNLHMDSSKKSQDINESNDEINIIKKGLVDDGIYEYELRSKHSILKYEFNPSTRWFWILNIETLNPNDQNKGYAKALLEHFFQIIKRENGQLDVGAFTTSGRYYIKHVIERLAKQYGIRWA